MAVPPRRSRVPGKIDPGVTGGDLTFEQLADSPLVLWKGFTTGGTDQTTNGRHGTVGGSITTGLPVTGTVNSYTFPGSAASAGAIQIADATWESPHIGGTGQMTLEAVINLSSLASDRVIWHKGANTSWEFHFWVGSNGSLQFTVWQLSGSNVLSLASSASVIAANTSYHVAATYSRAGTSYIYINGVQVASSSSYSSTSSDGTGVLTVGFRTDTATNPFIGRGSNFAMYSAALSAGRISTHAAAAGF